MNDDPCVVILITAATMEEAERIAGVLVSEKLAACVNIFPGIRSIFVWEGKRSQETEVLLMAKGRMGQWDRVVQRVKELHSYQVPEIIALPVLAGSEDYLAWVRENT
jgi:periplasmic divalent cation tolerance protein